MMLEIPYRYRANLLRVIDGDTVEVEVDLGFYTFITIHVRLEGIDAPELRAADPEEKQRAYAAKSYLEAYFISDKACIIETGKGRSFNRWVAVLYDPSGVNLNERMLELGLVRLAS